MDPRKLPQVMVSTAKQRGLDAVLRTITDGIALSSSNASLISGHGAPQNAFVVTTGRLTGKKCLKVAGLFAGIGGIELRLRKAGHDAVMLCENDPLASAVLDERFPEIPRVGDIREIGQLPRGTELLAAGFPCQDLSQAGNTKGINGSKSGLVGEVFRLLQAQRIPWVLLENVPFMLQLNRGAAMDHIVSHFERLGYRWAYRVREPELGSIRYTKERPAKLRESLRKDRRYGTWHVESRLASAHWAHKRELLPDGRHTIPWPTIREYEEARKAAARKKH